MIPRHYPTTWLPTQYTGPALWVDCCGSSPIVRPLWYALFVLPLSPFFRSHVPVPPLFTRTDTAAYDELLNQHKSPDERELGDLYEELTYCGV
jgi:hypothetical protein